jgi:hypothetical protein
MARELRRRSRGVGGVGDGLPALPDGEPLLQRWFVIPMIALVLIGLGVMVWMVVVVLTRESLPVAERRPPGTEVITHDRGDAILNDTQDTEPGPACAERIELFGDPGARGMAARALEAVCFLLATGDFPQAAEGMERWKDANGQLRVAVFELTGVEASSRVEQVEALGELVEAGPGWTFGGLDRIVMELNPRFQFEPGFRAAPMIIAELTHIAGDWPGQAVDAPGQLAALRAQRDACRALNLVEDPPRGCLDAELLVDAPDAIQQLVDAGYRP